MVKKCFVRYMGGVKYEFKIIVPICKKILSGDGLSTYDILNYIYIVFLITVAGELN